MNDKEIIMVLENELKCVKRQYGNICDNKRDCGKCDLALQDKIVICAYENVIDLINRQKAEIERLEKEIKDKERVYNDEFCSRKEWQTKCRELLKEKQITKSEAIKEFAEKLKKRFYLSAGRCVVDVYHIDNLVKEMTEVNENDRA